MTDPFPYPPPRETTDRCALRAQLRGDPMLGTAFPAVRMLLVEQPGPWGRDGLTESRFDPGVAVQLRDRLGAQGIRLLAIRRPGRTPRGIVRRWAWADCRPGYERLAWGRYFRDEELLDLDVADWADGAGPGRPDDQPLFLVCAHSKHDTCCALRGRPVAAAIDAERPGRAWECSHLGGERFAANVLVLPAGLLYGRVLTFAAPEFVRIHEEGGLVGALLRGRVGLRPAAQAALAFAHTHLGIEQVGAIRVRSMRQSDDEAVVGLSTPHGDVTVTVEIERSVPHHLTCYAERPSAAFVYRPVTLTPVAT